MSLTVSRLFFSHARSGHRRGSAFLFDLVVHELYSGARVLEREGEVWTMGRVRGFGDIWRAEIMLSELESGLLKVGLVDGR